MGNAKLSVRSFAKRIGIGASSLKMILSGKRNPTLAQVFLLAKAQRRPSSEVSYLETLCLKESAASDWEQAYYSKALKIKSQSIKIKSSTTSEVDLLNDPLVLPLLVDLMDSDSSNIDEKKLALRFSVTQKYISELIERFKSKKMLTEKSGGQFHIAFDKINHKFQQKKFIKDNLNESLRRVDSNYDNPTCFFTTYTFSATTENLLHLQMDLKILMEKYMSVDFKLMGDERNVAQASFQIFPVNQTKNLDLSQK
jgi:transcriptional regulator with XRE-family HTH domain